MTTAFQGTPLFVTPAHYAPLEKIAVVTLSRDVDEWEQEISQALHQEHPFITEHNIAISLTKTDAETGAGVGSILLDNKVVVPIIIDKFKLAPLDVFWYEEKLRPLTRESLEGVLQDTAIGTPVKPGQGEMTDASLYGRVQPPFDGKYTYASGFAAVATIDQLQTAVNAAFESADQLRAELRGSPRFADALCRFQTVALQNDQTVKTAACTKRKLGLRVFQGVRKMAGAGFIEAATAAGPVPALVFDLMLKTSGKQHYPLLPTRERLVVGLDKAASWVRLRGGQPLFGQDATPPTGLLRPDPQGREQGVFFQLSKQGSDLLGVCTEPIVIEAQTTDGWIGRFAATQQPMRLEKMAQIRQPVLTDDLLLVPADWRWLRMGEETQALSEQDAQLRTLPKQAFFSLLKTAGRLTARGLDGFPQDGGPIEKTAALLKERFDERQVDLLVAAAPSGELLHVVIEPEATAPLRKTAAIAPRNLLKEATYVRPCAGQSFPLGPGGKLVKVAAVTDDEAQTTVDALLGLNFLNPDNLYRFAEQMDKIVIAKEATAKLLIASRLGLEVDSRPLRTAMFALDAVERDLRELQNAVETPGQKG